MSIEVKERSWLFRPWFYSPKEGEKSTPENIQKQYKGLDPKPFYIKTTSPATSLGLGALVIGAVLALFGINRDSKSTTWSGGILAGAAAAISIIGKFCGVELNEDKPNSDTPPVNPPSSPPPPQGDSLPVVTSEQLKTDDSEARPKTGGINEISQGEMDDTQDQESTPQNDRLVKHPGFVERVLKPSQEFPCGYLGRIQIRHVGLFDLRCRLFIKDDCSVLTGRNDDDDGTPYGRKGISYIGKEGNQCVYDIALSNDRFISLSNPEESLIVSIEATKIWTSVKLRVREKQRV